jgi:hypothetical protein
VARPSSNRTNSTGCPRTSTVAFPNRLVRGALLVCETQQAGGHDTARMWSLTKRRPLSRAVLPH